MPDIILEKQITKHQGGYRNQCETCSHRFDMGESKVRWRLNLPTSNKYLRGQFWTIQCSNCIQATKVQWIEALEEL